MLLWLPDSNVASLCQVQDPTEMAEMSRFPKIRGTFWQVIKVMWGIYIGIYTVWRLRFPKLRGPFWEILMTRINWGS